MKPKKFLESQGYVFDESILVGEESIEINLKELCGLLGNYADIEANDTAKQEKTSMLKKMLENDSISRENHNYYYQTFCK